MSSLTIKEYFALAGSHFSNDDARAIGPVLQELAAAGDVTPAAVVQAAHSQNSPLRRYFEWDNKKAASLYREGQAAEMIQAVRVRFISDGKEYAARAYNVAVKPHKNYLPREIAVGDNVMPHPLEILLGAIRELDAWRIKYAHLQGMKRVDEVLVPLFNQISEFKEEYAVGSRNAAGASPVDLDEAIAQLTNWKLAFAGKIPTTKTIGKHIAYMIEAIDAAWEQYCKIKNDKYARDKAVERENEELRERILQLESLLHSHGNLPSQLQLTAKEEAIVTLLLDRDSITKEQAMIHLYSDRIDAPPNNKIIDIFICKIRAKIESFGINIETLWGRGYTMPPDSKAELLGMIEAHRAAQESVNAAADTVGTKASP